jgi:hypothetical protein
VRGERTLQDGVLLVDQVRERLLGDRDERQVVGDLEEREAVLGGGLDQRLRRVLVREADAQPQPGELVVREPLDERALARCVGEVHPRSEQQLAA